MAAPVLQIKRGLLANLPGLRAGEPGFTTDSYDLYVGIDSTTNNNKFFGSHRYWKKETSSTGSGINLVEGTSNGEHYITLASPASVGAAVTYYLPATQGASYSVLTNNGSGNLSWVSGLNNSVFTGISTFSDTTDNTLGDENTGSVQLDGGMGIAKNLTVKQNLHVGGYSEFVGVVTFKGGTINIGDSNTDDINVAGEFISNLIPNSDATYDIGSGSISKRWRHSSFSGVGTFASGSVNNNVKIGISSAGEIDTSSGNLILDSSSGKVIVDDELHITGVISAFNGATIIGGETTLSSLTISDLTDKRILFVSGDGSIVDDQDLTYDGTDLTTGSLVVLDITDNRILIGGNGGAVEDSANLTFDGSTLTVVGYSDLDNVNVSSAATITNASITNATISNTTFGTGTAITGVDIDLSAVSLSDDTLASAKAIKGYVDAVDLNFTGDSGIGTIVLNSQTLAISGTLGEIVTTASGQTISIGLPDNVVIGAGLTVTTALDVNGGADISGGLIVSSGGINVTGVSTFLTDIITDGDVRINGNEIKSSTGAVAITLADNDVTIADDLTVSGNLYVNGNTTQVNTTSLTVEDRTIDLGIVNGSTPASNTTWDLGVLFNYYTSGSAKKSAVIWEHGDSRFKFASVLGSDTNGTNSDTPQLTVTTFAPIEVAELWVNNTCTGGSQQVIGCLNSELQLQNITIDAGTF